MKRLFSFFLCIIMLSSLCVLACGCYGDAKLVYNKKYMHIADIDKNPQKQNYLIFYRDGTGEYQEEYYSGFAYYTHKYTFVYTVIKGEATVDCLLLNSNGTYAGSKTFIISDFMIMATNGEKFYLEDYIKDKLPN